MHKHGESPEPADSGLPYATDDVDFPVLAKAAVLLLIFTIFSTALAGGAYWLFVVRETVQPAHVLEAVPTPPDPNVPMLQKDPEAEIHKFRADEYDAERSYSHWKDGDGKSSLRIPISRAMEIVKAAGLPKPVKSEPGAQQPTISQTTNPTAGVTRDGNWHGGQSNAAIPGTVAAPAE